MKIQLINNTASDLLLTNGIRPLGKRERKELDLTTAAFEELKPHFDALSTKGLLTYSIISESSAIEPSAPRNALVLPHPEIKQLRENLNASIDVLGTRLSDTEKDLLLRLAAVEEKLASLASPDPLAYRIEASNIVAQSSASYAPLTGMQLTVPASGRWFIIAEVGLQSPIPSKGKVCLGRLGGSFLDTALDGSERTWARTQDDPTFVLITASASFSAGDVVSIYWKMVEGVLRSTNRSLTILRLS